MRKVKFMGRMAAAASHDLCNVLATIQQAAGLLGDYLSLARRESLKTAGFRPKFKYHEKFQDILGQVQVQVDRGQNLCEQLSSLAHSPEENQAGTDLGQAVGLLIKLSGRVAKKHHVVLELMESGETFMAAAPLIEVLTALDAALLGVVLACGGGRVVRAESGGDGTAQCSPDEGRIIRFVPGGDEAGFVNVDILCRALGDEAALALADALVGDETGPFTAGVVRGGVRLAFERAGRKP
jgi:signal transduction histidine kinase